MIHLREYFKVIRNLNLYFPPEELFIFICKCPYQGMHVSTVMVNSSLVAQLVKNLLALQETSVQFLGPEDPLKK